MQNLMLALSMLSLGWVSQAAPVEVDATRTVVGIGIQADLNDQGQLIIAGLVEGAPAQQSGEIAVGDEVTAVKSNPEAQMEQIAGKTIEEIGPLFAGEVGQEITLKIKRDGKEFDVTLVRAEFEVEEPQE